MLVAPHHQVNKVIQELLRDVISGTVLTPTEDTEEEKTRCRVI